MDKGTLVGQEIIKALKELKEVVDSGEKLTDYYNVYDIEIDE